MTDRKRGHPKAEDLEHRCSATNRTGSQCGSPAIKGLSVCKVHLQAVAPNKLLSVPEKLRELTDAALDRLADVIAHGKDADAVRAAGLVLGVTIPRQVLLTPLMPDQDGGTTSNPADLIRQRLAKIQASRPASAVEPSSTLPDFPDLVGPTEPPAARPVRRQLSALSAAPEPVALQQEPDLEPEVIDAELVEESVPESYGVARISRRALSEEDLGREGWSRGARYR